MVRKIHDNTSPRNQAGRLRMMSAMEHLERARTEIERAQQELSSVVGLSPIYNKLREMVEVSKEQRRGLDQIIHQTVSRTNEFTQGHLDRDPAPEDLKPHAGCGCQKKKR